MLIGVILGFVAALVAIWAVDKFYLSSPYRQALAWVRDQAILDSGLPYAEAIVAAEAEVKRVKEEEIPSNLIRRWTTFKELQNAQAARNGMAPIYN